MDISKLAFVDLETTGGSNGDKIIEIGIVRVENNVVKDTLETLVNPETYVPQEIFNFTGINPLDLENARGFNSLSRDLLEYLDGYIVVAHNARFDYGFLKKSFAAEGLRFKAKTLCTVRLSRRLYPEFDHHNLDAIISRYGIVCHRRHRALDDAMATWKFFEQAKLNHPEEDFNLAVSEIMKKVTIPSLLPKKRLGLLPEKPGVYIFYNSDGAILYIGKSTNIKERVISHFTNDFQSSTDLKLSQFVADVEHVETSGDFSACLLESKLIKERKPIYNKLLRENSDLIALILNTEEKYYSFDTVDLSSVPGVQVQKILAVYKSKREMEEDINNKIKQFGLCDKWMKTHKAKGECFGFGIGRCKGACVGIENPGIYNARFIEAFSEKNIKRWPFEGPIVIGEWDHSNEKTLLHIVDKWCYLGTREDEYEFVTPHEDEYTFDYDTYRIIRKWLANPANQRGLRILKQLNK
jgi:DNA polymerase-3 subunit epsilon